MRLPRIAAVVLVGVFTCLILGGVWGTVILLLPHDGHDSISLAQPMPVPNRPSVPASGALIADTPSTPEESSLAALPPPDPLPTPPAVERAGHSGAMVPLNIEIRCEAEIESACPEGSFEERRRCLQGKSGQLSIPCRQRAREHLVRIKASLHQIRAACGEDVRRFCSSVEPGRGSILQCLEDRAQEVSDPCFQSLPKRGRLMN